MANLGNEIPITPQTQFLLAFLSKQFTTMGIMIARAYCRKDRWLPVLPERLLKGREAFGGAQPRQGQRPLIPKCRSADDEARAIDSLSPIARMTFLARREKFNRVELD